jgi:hypothetical protein
MLPGLEEPRKVDHFPEEPSIIALSELLAKMTGRTHIDKWWCWKK